MINAHVPLFFGQSGIDLQTVQIEVAVGDVEWIGAILFRVPNLLHAQNELVKSREAAIVVGTHSHVFYCRHLRPPDSVFAKVTSLTHIFSIS
jgi:hypothetical protein